MIVGMFRTSFPYSLGTMATRRRPQPYHAQALDIAKDWQPEVVFVDLAMPGMNGYDVASQLRSAGFTSTKIIALSGHQEDRERGENAGIDGHILKPISMVKIKSLLGNCAVAQMNAERDIPRSLMTTNNVLPISIFHRKGAFVVSQGGYRGRESDQRCDYQLVGSVPRRAFVIDGATTSTLRFPSSQELVYWLGRVRGKGLSP